MAVKAINSEYKAIELDTIDKFHGNQLVYVNWEKHLMFCAPIALPLPPDAPFSALTEEALPGAYGAHPDWEKVAWDKAEWTLDGEAFTPRMDASLADNGVGHKSVLRFTTPGLDGIQGCAS